MTHRFAFVSVIIPVKDDAARLQLCLTAISKQTYPKDRYEVIVVDNNSTDPIDEAVAKFPGVQLLRETTPGPAAARNTGVAHAKGDVIAFTDADCIPMPEWIQEGVPALEHAPIIGGRIEIMPPASHRSSFAERYSYTTSLQQEYLVQKKFFAATANMFLRREIWETIGVFDIRLLTNEDKEFCQRARNIGTQTAYAPSAMVEHPIQYHTMHALVHKTASYIRGQVQYWRLQGAPKTALLAALFQDVFPTHSFMLDALTHTRKHTANVRHACCNKFQIAFIRLLLVGPIQFFARIYFVTQRDRVFVTPQTLVVNLNT